MSTDIASLQEFPETERYDMRVAGCCALWSILTCETCTILCTRDTDVG